jgi:hypothetical protein
MKRVPLDAPVLRSPRRALRDTNRRVLPPGASHGNTGYHVYGCRCDECTDAVTFARRRSDRRRRGELDAYEPPGRTHGLIATYNAGCHCEECKRAARDCRARSRARARAAEDRTGADAVECIFCGEPILWGWRGNGLRIHEQACQRRRAVA